MFYSTMICLTCSANPGIRVRITSQIISTSSPKYSCAITFRRLAVSCREFGMFISKTLRHLPSSFANYLETMDYCQKCTTVILQVRDRAYGLREVQDIVTSLENILQIQVGITRRHKASLFRRRVLQQA